MKPLPPKSLITLSGDGRLETESAIGIYNQRVDNMFYQYLNMKMLSVTYVSLN